MREALRWVQRFVAVVLMLLAAFMSLGLLVSERTDSPGFTLFRMMLFIFAPCLAAWTLILWAEKGDPMCRTHKMSEGLAWLLPGACLFVAAIALPWGWTACLTLASAAAAKARRGTISFPRLPKLALPGRSEKPRRAAAPAPPLAHRLQRLAVILLVELPDALLGKKG